jgi:hypothetical protein
MVLPPCDTRPNAMEILPGAARDMPFPDSNRNTVSNQPLTSPVYWCGPTGKVVKMAARVKPTSL